MLAMRALTLLATALGAAAQPSKCVGENLFRQRMHFHTVSWLVRVVISTLSPPTARTPQELRDEWHAVRAAQLDAQLESDHVHDLPAQQ